MHLKYPFFVDPPEGWKYGFPRVKNDDTPMLAWLLSKGYPQELIDVYGEQFGVRMWYATEPSDTPEPGGVQE